jgi:hypothetical protein
MQHDSLLVVVKTASIGEPGFSGPLSNARLPSPPAPGVN